MTSNVRTNDPTKLPGIPKAPAGATAEEKRWYDTIAQIMEIRLGLRGDPRDRAITLRELISSGLAIDLKASPFNPNAIGGINIGFSNPQIPNLDMPPTPTGFTANGAYSQVNLFWDFPLYTNHAHTELWRGSTDIIGDAQLLGIELGRSFVDAVGSGQSNYYWIRHVSQDGVFGFFNSTSGTLGATAVDVDLLLGVLNGAITSSELANSLTTSIAAIPGIQTTLGDIDTDLSGINSDLSGINSDLSGINSDISGLSGNVNTLTSNQANFATTVQLNDYTTTTYVNSNYYTLNEVDQAITAEINTFNSQTLTANYTNTADLTTNYYTKTSADGAITAGINTFNAQTLAANYTNTADLTTNYYTKTSADGAISAAINTFNTNTIGPTYTSTADLTTNYYTKTSADGAISAAINTFNTNTIGPTYTSTADLTTNYYTKTSADGAISAAINTFNTNTIGPTYTSTADLTLNYYTKTSADGAISAAITSYNTNTIGANYSTTADIQQAYYTKTQADTAFASTSDILNAQVDDPDGGTSQVTLAQAMSTQADVNGELKGQYTVKIDANGSIAGFGLASTTTAAGANTSEFYVNADRFAIITNQAGTADPAWASGVAYANGARVQYGGDLFIARIAHTSYSTRVPPNALYWVAGTVVPFAVQATGTTTADGVYIPPGVYMNSAMIKHATITDAQIGSVNADTITTGELDVANLITANAIDASKLNIDGSSITSFVDPNTGAATLRLGDVNVNNLTGTSISATIMSGTTVYANRLTGDVNTIVPFRTTTSTYFNGLSNEVTLQEVDLPATTHLTEGHKVYASAGGYISSTENKVYYVKMYIRATPTSSYVLAGEMRVKSGTNSYLPFSVFGVLNTPTTGIARMKLTIRRYGTNSVTPDTATTADYVRERQGAVMGVH